MSPKKRQETRVLVTGQLVGENSVISFAELCRCCTLEHDELRAMVQEGILDPFQGRRPGRDIEQWQFHMSSIRRARTAARLQRDLGVNLAGAALALELLDRIEELETRLFDL